MLLFYEKNIKLVNLNQTIPGSLDKFESWNTSYISKLNEEAENEMRNVEERLLQQHYENMWYDRILKRFYLIFFLYFKIMSYHITPIQINKYIMFSTTPHYMHLVKYSTQYPHNIK